MVEISGAKKRRGTASLKGRTNGGPPKAYWPGLEIDEYDKKNTNNNNNNNDDSNIGSYNNNNGSSNDNSNSIMQRTNGILHTKNKRTGDGKPLSSPRQMDVVVNSNAPIPSTTTKENNTNGTSSFRPKRRKRKRCVPPTDKKVEAQQQQQNQKQHHQMIVDEEEKEEDDDVNNGSRSSRNDHSSKTVTKKKKKKTTATKIILTLGNKNSDNVEITSTTKPTKENLSFCMENNADENNHRSKNDTIYEEAEGNNVSCLPPNTNNSKELERTIRTSTSASNASSSSSSTSVCTATIANDGNKCTNTSPLFSKNDEPQTETIRATTVGTKMMTLKDTTMATMTSDAAITATANPLTANATATATTTAKTDMAYDDDNDAKMEMKTPTALAGFLLRKKLPVIDEVLSNIRDVLLGMVSPSLQNRITTTSGGTMSHSCSNSNSSKNNLNVNVNSTKQSHNQHEEEEEGEVVVTSKFHDVCEQQEKFLERMERIELAAAKREEEFLKRTTEEPQNRREENLVTELKRHIQDKSKYQSEIKEKNRVIKDLKESKRSTQRLFQSRLDEQFRELSKRETENENLRKRIAILEQSSKKSNCSTVSTTTNHVSDLIAACQGGGSDR